MRADPGERVDLKDLLPGCLGLVLPHVPHAKRLTIQIVDLDRVSVTQQFNTTSSMGRLVLNILLSFAQFEREIIGERIRDKVAATKRKGKYCGGMPVLGYDVDRERKRLVVNPAEAVLVRHIFQRFVQTGSTTELAKELNAKGHRTKSWTTKTGKLHPGQPWNKAHIYSLLNNPLYIGEVSHKGNRYPGEHEAIVSRDLWDQAHAILETNGRARAGRTRATTPALLRGILRCAHCGCAMGPTFSKKRGKLYRYYLCVHASKNGYDSCPTRTLSAGEIERAVVDQLRAILRAPEFLAQTYRAARVQADAHLEELSHRRNETEESLGLLRQEVAHIAAGDNGRSGPVATCLAELQAQIAEEESVLASIEAEAQRLGRDGFTEREVAEALGSLDPIWDNLFPDEQARIVQLLVKQVEVYPDRAEVRIRAEGLASLVAELREEQENAA